MHHLLFQDLSKGKQEGEERTGVNSSRESSGGLTSAIAKLLAVARDGREAALTSALGRTAGIRLEGLGEAWHECSEAGKLVVGGAAGAPPQR